MRRKHILLFTACVSVMLFAVVLSWAPRAPSPSSLGVAFLAYTNGTQAVFRVTNPSSDTLQLAPNCLLISEQGRPLGSLPLVGVSSGKRLLPRAADTVAISRPPGTGSWR